MLGFDKDKKEDDKTPDEGEQKTADQLAADEAAGDSTPEAGADDVVADDSDAGDDAVDPKKSAAAKKAAETRKKNRKVTVINDSGFPKTDPSSNVRFPAGQEVRDVAMTNWLECQIDPGVFSEKKKK